ncbi:MAG: hypothetical protein GOMPHAMPRED_000547 [Gomphillus americanus]|uniref:Double-strand break repair protein n=1 Tax=Gomphillus americanus TaxID=1940652 RepID=A0A8H3I411_9LECA|nr:MAG: hypothetical protein GOMPHAMPRED_000547 [Gomphillus americanus]
MSQGPDTIRILVSTDNHVGYEERDPIRKNDSANSFNEVLEIAKERDVDMVLLAGDLFHDNKPSRQSLFQVIRSLRINCLGPKPCQLEVLSDQSEAFEGYFNHVNYEDPDINVAIPVFSIHGNHDDPTGDGQLAALDVLHETGLINYYGRIRDSATIDVRPVLIQKGRTKLALYGMSNVRDERLFHTFKAGNVTFHQPTQQEDEWFNLLSVHQNRHAYTATSYLEEELLPDCMDLVIWGHEHECLIEPHENEVTGFKIIQPGSTVATSLVPGEAKQKMVTILSITGKDFEHEPIALKTVRPFVYRDVVLAEDPIAKKLAMKVANRDAISKRLKDIIEEMIQQAQNDWLEVNTQNDARTGIKIPEPLVRLRVEYTAPEKGSFDCENPRRLSNAFQGRVANQNDVVYFWKRKRTRQSRTSRILVPDVAVTEQLSSAGLDTVVQQLLAVNPLIILPRNHFGEAMFKFVEKDEKAALEAFVDDQHEKQKSALLDLETQANEQDLDKAIEAHRTRQEETFVPGTNTATTARPTKATRPSGRPADWNSEEDGIWQEAEDVAEVSDEESVASRRSTPAPPTRGRGRGRGRGAAATTSRATKSKAATTSKPTATKTKSTPAKKQGTLAFTTRGKRNHNQQHSKDGSDVEMIDEPEPGLFLTQPSGVSASQTSRFTSARESSVANLPSAKRPTRAAAIASQRFRTAPAKAQPFVELDDDVDEISDDDDEEDAFEPV